MTTVANLRQNGTKVRVIHRRWYFTNEIKPEYYLFSKFELNEFLLNNPFGPELILDVKGGHTIVEITTPDNETVIGASKCSIQDNYNRKFGLTKAFGRALGQLKENN